MERTGEDGYVEEIQVDGGSARRILFVDGKQYGTPSPLVPFGKQVETVSLDGRPIKVGSC